MRHRTLPLLPFLAAILFACPGDREDEAAELEPETAELAEPAPGPDGEADEPAIPTETDEETEVAALTVAELRELRARLGLAPPSPPAVQNLLTRADIREILRYDGLLRELPLQGQEPSPGWNAMRIAPEDGLGVAVQRWIVDDPAQRDRRFRRLRDTWIAVDRDAPELGQASFGGTFDGVHHLAFRHDRSRSIIVITLDGAMGDGEQLRTLGARIAERL
ncbi:MAG: hypothetical protein EA398_04885 [Deltaproteobacteria bacterium]|nr:MAG: hypothetical protein EA398_04885 [Deltaproteobacteria bacterium]